MISKICNVYFINNQYIQIMVNFIIIRVEVKIRVEETDKDKKV